MSPLPARIDAEPETVGRDLGRLVLTIVELLRQLMERQAIRRVEAGVLPEETVERLGLGLMRLEEAMDELREYFGLRPEDLNIDLVLQRHSAVRVAVCDRGVGSGRCGLGVVGGVASSTR